MRTDLVTFWLFVRASSSVQVDNTAQYFLLNHPSEGWLLYQRGLDAAFLLAVGEEALRWAPEFRIPQASESSPAQAGER
jgi:hypothetical protein